jgi:hypothetical protein
VKIVFINGVKRFCFIHCLSFLLNLLTNSVPFLFTHDRVTQDTYEFISLTAKMTGFFGFFHTFGLLLAVFCSKGLLFPKVFVILQAELRGWLLLS